MPLEPCPGCGYAHMPSRDFASLYRARLSDDWVRVPLCHLCVELVLEGHGSVIERRVALLFAPIAGHA